MYGNTSTTWTNYFAKITSQAWGTGTEELNTSANEASVFPNPVLEDYYRVKLDLPVSGMLQIKLLDINGRLVKDIFAVHAVKGQNLFSFNKNNKNNFTTISAKDFSLYSDEYNKNSFLFFLCNIIT